MLRPPLLLSTSIAIGTVGLVAGSVLLVAAAIGLGAWRGAAGIGQPPVISTERPTWRDTSESAIF